jgi:hypothetical protein
MAIPGFAQEAAKSLAGALKIPAMFDIDCVHCQALLLWVYGNHVQVLRYVLPILSPAIRSSQFVEDKVLARGVQTALIQLSSRVRTCCLFTSLFLLSAGSNICKRHRLAEW